MEKLYVLRNGCIVSLKELWRVKIISNPRGIDFDDGLSLKVKNKEYISLAWGSPWKNLYKINGEYCLYGGVYGEGFDLVKEYTSEVIQEEMDV